MMRDSGKGVVGMLCSYVTKCDIKWAQLQQVLLSTALINSPEW